MSFFANLMHGLGSAGGQMSQSFEEIQRQDLARAEARARQEATNKQLYQTAVSNMQTYETDRLDREAQSEQAAASLAQQQREARDTQTYREGTLGVQQRDVDIRAQQVNQSSVNLYNSRIRTDPTNVVYGEGTDGRVKSIDIDEVTGIISANQRMGDDEEGYSMAGALEGLKELYPEMDETERRRALMNAYQQSQLVGGLQPGGIHNKPPAPQEEKGGGFFSFDWLGGGGDPQTREPRDLWEEAGRMGHRASGVEGLSQGMSSILDSAVVAQGTEEAEALAFGNKPAPGIIPSTWGPFLTEGATATSRRDVVPPELQERISDQVIEHQIAGIDVEIEGLRELANERIAASPSERPVIMQQLKLAIEQKEALKEKRRSYYFPVGAAQATRPPSGGDFY